MKKEYFEFLEKLLKKITDVYSEYGDTLELKMEYHANKDYYTFDFEFRNCNSGYTDCIVFCLNDDFEPEEILDRFDEITEKVKLIFE